MMYENQCNLHCSICVILIKYNAKIFEAIAKIEISANTLSFLWQSDSSHRERGQSWLDR